ncbi:hypothetical protein ACA086_00040 [Muriicola sp. E247]|uniref:hypothetical protein n=1 Tax=Muriicola sp. E247 TaxID=3242730 RepID=UPI0035256E62
MQQKIEQQDRIEMLKDILFPEEHMALKDISSRLKLLEELLQDEETLREKVDPIIEKKLDAHLQALDKNIGASFYATLEKNIREEPEKMSELLSPLMGTLLKIHRKKRRHALLDALLRPFGYLKFQGEEIKSRFGATTEEQKLQKQLKSNRIEQVFLIDRRNGELRASYSETNRLTVVLQNKILDLIESRVSKSTGGESQHLDLIPFKGYQIYLQRFVTHHVVVVVSGKKDLPCTEKLQDIIFTFYYKFMSVNLDLLTVEKGKKTLKKTIDRTTLEEAMATCFKQPSL